MTVFIGTEYLIGLCLLRQLRSGSGSVSFQEVRCTAGILQEALNAGNVDVILIDNDIMQTMAEFEDYFQMV